VPGTRSNFHEELEELEREALTTADLAASALDQVVEAVLTGDAELAQMVIDGDDRIDGRYLDVHQGVLSLLARQAPVASDLRLVAALLHTIVHIERIGDLCVNIAKLVPLTGQSPSQGQEILQKIQAAGTQARDQIRQAQTAFRERNLELAEDIVRQDDVIDLLNREVFSAALEIGGSDVETREWAAHQMLIARYLERIGDHTVDIGEQIAFVISGEFREFTDASHPTHARGVRST
jgi:phosphate transport system protein